MFCQVQPVSMKEIEANLPTQTEVIPQEIGPEPDYYHEENGVPIFTPDYASFKDFYKYIKSIERHGHKAGLVKVIPPKEWLDQQNTSIEKLQNVKINRPISQTFNCGGLPAGAHRQLNIESKKSYSVQEWYEMCRTTYSAPVFSERGTLMMPEQPKKRKRSDQEVLVEDSQDSESVGGSSPEKKEIALEKEIPEKPAYMTALNEKTDPEYLAALERFYWRNLSFQNTMYGADLQASIFTDNEENKWDMRSLESLLCQVNVDVPGVTNPYLYFGMYKATFSWHVEDMDLFSINYLHFGAPKMWYVVPPAERSRFESLAASYFYDEAQTCPEFTRHKVCVISPSVLEKHHITVHKLVQKTNEFVITFPAAYHQGWNTDFNCAEAINFATPAWINFGRAAQFCECVQDSVAIDVEGIFGVDENFKMPRPKAKPKKKAPMPKFLPMVTTKKVKVSKKNEPVTKKVWELPRPKCALCPLGDSVQFPLMPTEKRGVWAHVECGAYIPETSVELIQEGLALIDDQITAELKSGQDTGEDASAQANIAGTADPVSVGDLSQASSAEIADQTQFNSPNNIGQASSQEENKKSTTLDPAELNPNPDSYTDKEESIAPYRVLGISEVPADRKRLKCGYCQWDGPISRDLGACIQCTRGKCTRSYHVTCAILAGVHVELNDDGDLVSYCYKHDPVYAQQRKEQQKQQLVADAVSKFAVGTNVVAKWGGWTYEGVVLEIQVEQRGCMVQFEEQEEACFAPFEMLKVKPEVEAPKAKKAPVYTDSKPRKNQMQEILSQFIGDGFSTDSPALGCEKSMEKSQETIVDDTMNEKIVDTNEASQETVTEPEKQSNGINPQDLLTLAQQSLML